MRRISYALPLVAALTVSACGGGAPVGPDDGNGNGNGNGNNGTRVIKAAPSFANDIQEIFNRRGCTASSCHGSAQSAGLNLQSGSSYANLVGVDATSENKVRVIPGNADQSYLVIKLEGRQSVGARMPLVGAALDNIDLTNIKNWINQNAVNN